MFWPDLKHSLPFLFLVSFIIFSLLTTNPHPSCRFLSFGQECSFLSPMFVSSSMFQVFLITETKEVAVADVR